VFPTDWPMESDAADGSEMVRVRVEVKGKGVARRGAALWADDLPADQMSASADDDAETTSEPSAQAATDTVMEDAGEAVAAKSAQPTEQPLAEAETVALGHVTSEVPRGAARGAAASALCWSAALQHLRWG